MAKHKTRSNGNGSTRADDVIARGEQELNLRTAASQSVSNILFERLRWARQAGITFGGARDLYQVLGYDSSITLRQYKQRYLRGGIAGRIIDVMPDSTWRGQPAFEVVEDKDADPKTQTEFEKAWVALDQRLQVTPKFLRVDKLARLSTFAVLLIGADGELETELPKGGKDQKKVLYLTPFVGGGGPGGSAQERMAAGGDADATVGEYDLDLKSPRFGLPKSYQLRRVDVNVPLSQRLVHWSRVVHVAENLLEDDVFGMPALERVWNLLDDLDKVTGGGAEAFWLRANQGLHLNIDKDMTLPDAQAAIAGLKEQSEDYKHQLTRWLRTRGVDAKTLGSDVANFANPADAILTQIAGSKAIPKRILTGSEMGELASSQDRENFKDQINGRQTGYAGPYIVRQLIDRLIQYEYLPSPKEEMTYEVRWPHMQALTEEEKATGAVQWATVNKTQGVTVFTDDEIRDHWYQKGPLTPEQKVPIAAPVREQAQATDNPDALAKAPKVPVTPVASVVPALKAAESFEGEAELLRVLEAAIIADQPDVIAAILRA